MGHTKAVSDFSSIHPKLFSVLTEKIKEIVPFSHYTKLIDVGQMRWIAHIEGLDVFREIFEGFIAAFDELRITRRRTGAVILLEMHLIFSLPLSS